MNGKVFFFFYLKKKYTVRFLQNLECVNIHMMSCCMNCVTRSSYLRVLSFCIQTFRSYTKEEISAHNTRTDCWVIIKDKVIQVQQHAVSSLYNSL